MAPSIAAVGTFFPGEYAENGIIPLGKPAGVSALSMLLATYSVEHNASGTLLEPPPGWLNCPDAPAFQAVASGTALYAFYKIVADPADEPATYDMPGQTGRWSRGAILRIDGHDPNNPWDGGDSAVLPNSSSTPTVTVTTTGPDRLIIWTASSYNESNWAAMPTGFTEHPSWVSSGVTVSTLATRELAAAGGAGGAVAAGTSTGKAAWIGAIRPAPASGPLVEPGRFLLAAA